MNNILLDTNAVIYFLKNENNIKHIVEKTSKVYISVISQIELLSYPKLTKADEKIIKGFISCCELVNINKEIVKYTINYRKVDFLKIPDAIIAASAKYSGADLVTADLEILRKLTDINVINPFEENK